MARFSTAWCAKMNNYAAPSRFGMRQISLPHFVREGFVVVAMTMFAMPGLAEELPVRLSLGVDNACAVTSDDELVCWDDQTEYRASPDLGPVHSIAVNSKNVCAIKRDGELICLSLSESPKACGSKNMQGRLVCQMEEMQRQPLVSKNIGSFRSI